jgi:signal transduction histidine kinase
MTRGAAPATAPPQSLRRLRLRLTAWYVGTFFAILVVLGGAMFSVITDRLDRDVDGSLRDATQDLAAAIVARGPRGAIDALRIPKRTLIVTDRAGGSLAGPPAEPWIAELARAASAHGFARASHADPNDRVLRASARAAHAPSGDVVAVAVADEIELEDRYASLIAAFGAGALGALILVAAGGWLLARKSTEPVERAILHMRRFMADAAHELRTPITVVRSRAEVALQLPRASDDYVETLRAIDRDAGRLSRIVEDLLMLARADVGERPIAHERVFLDDVTSDAVEAARAIAARRSTRVEVEEFDEAPVVGDAALLRQLVLILLDNAIKFTGRNGVVQVAVRALSPIAELRVADTGIGIPPEQLGHVFERFYRGDPSRTRVPSMENPRDGSGSDGAGLGLSIAQWIAEQHDAVIRIDSRLGHGTTVTVRFPAALAGDSVLSS